MKKEIMADGIDSMYKLGAYDMFYAGMIDQKIVHIQQLSLIIYG